MQRRIKKKIQLDSIESYMNKIKDQNLDKKLIQIDSKYRLLLLPINGQLIPFHFNCIKNLTY